MAAFHLFGTWKNTWKKPGKETCEKTWEEELEQTWEENLEKTWDENLEKKPGKRSWGKTFFEK